MPLIIILAIIGVMIYYFGFFTDIVYFVEFFVLLFGIAFLMRKYESKHGEIAPDEEVKERAKKVKLMEAKPLSFFEKASFITVLAITLLSAHYFGIWTAIKSLFIFLSIIGYFLLLWDYVLVRYKKPKEIFPSQKLNYELPEFDFAELINKCREQPEKFIEEWKHKPIIVTGFAQDKRINFYKSL